MSERWLNENDQWLSENYPNDPRVLDEDARLRAHRHLDALQEVLGHIPAEVLDLLDELIDEGPTAPRRVAAWLAAVVEG